MKRIVTIAMIISLTLLSSCILFLNINEPYVSQPNETVIFCVNVTTEGGEYEPYFGVCLPTGWTVVGDSLKCGGAYNEVIYYDSLVSIEQENASPAPEGYYWWAGKGAVDTSAIGYVSANLYVHTDDELGRFFIDFMLGDSYNGVNQQRSDDHQIDIVDEFTPYRLLVSNEGSTIILTWYHPVNTSGLLGYNVYCDGQPINPFLITGTNYTVENPSQGIHRYKISAFYNNGTEHLLPYEIPVMFGDHLFVSPAGDNNNSGSSFDEALLTIGYALSLFTSDSLNHKTIYLSEGVFSPGTTGEVFPIVWKNYISLIGITKEVTILDADSLSSVLELNSITEAKFNNLTIRNGNNYEGGGIAFTDSSPDLLDIIIKDNFAAYRGGGIFCNHSSPELVNVIITDNLTDQFGGGIYLIHGSHLKLTNVLIKNNSAKEGAGIICDWFSHPNLEDVIITNNTAVDIGGGIYCWGSNLFLLNVTLTGNSAGMFGGGILCEGGSNPILKNCILWNDSPEEICFNDFDDSNTVTISYSDIQGGETGIVTNNNGSVNWLEGNIDEDPLLIETGDYPYRLSSGSPCIDAGDPNPIYNDPEDPNNLSYAMWPAMGTIRNDMGGYGGPNAASWNIVTGIEDDKNIAIQTPTEFELVQNYPNPFNPSTTINYSLKERTSVELILYDILGRQVEVLINEEQDAGYYKINFNAGHLASGIYFYRIMTNGFVETKKMILMK